MERTSRASESQYQPCWAILIFRVILDNDSPCTRLANLLLANVPLHGASEGMLGVIEFAGTQLSLDLGQGLHNLSSATRHPVR